MTVRELRTLLQGLPDNARVVVKPDPDEPGKMMFLVVIESEPQKWVSVLIQP
jgi:hypothetical protein